MSDTETAHEIGLADPQTCRFIGTIHLCKPTRIEAVIATICVHCRDRGYSRSVERDAADFAVLRLRNGASGSSAVRSGQLRADHLNDVYGSRKDAS